MRIFDIFKKKHNSQLINDSDKNYVKILFRFHSDIFDEEMVETMWATTVDIEKGFFKLDNIPFYAPHVASDDIVFAEFDKLEECMTYRKTIQFSGNSTIHVVVMNKTKDINSIRDIFKDFGCVTERVNESYYSMEIPADINYQPIKKMLDDLEQKKIIGYTESCLSDKHKL